MPQTPDDVIRQWFREVWDEGHEEAIDRLMAPDGKVHGLSGPGGPPLTGPAAFCRVRGRHVGNALGGPPTDRDVDFTGVTIARVQNGKIVEGWNVFDFLTMYQQIGWAQNPVTP